MKLKIEKTSGSEIRIVLEIGSGQKPTTIDVTIEQLRGYMALLQAGVRGDKFKLEIEL